MYKLEELNSTCEPHSERVFCGASTWGPANPRQSWGREFRCLRIHLRPPLPRFLLDSFLHHHLLGGWFSGCGSRGCVVLTLPAPTSGTDELQMGAEAAVEAGSITNKLLSFLFIRLQGGRRGRVPTM